MVLASALYSSGGGGIPTGDKLRLVEAGPFSGSATVLNLTATSGTLWGFIIRWTPPGAGSGTAEATLSSVTVDGAATRNYNIVIQQTRWAAGTAANSAFSGMVSIPIKFTSSLQVTMSLNTATGTVVAVYSVD